MPTFISSDFSTSNQYIKYRLVVTETGTNISNNTSSVNIKLEAWRTNQGYTTDGHCYAICFVDGVEYFDEWHAGDGHAISYNSYTVMLERDLTIEHNADGKKSINVSAYFDHSRFSSNEQGFTVNLTDIPRQANLTGASNFNDTQNPTIAYSNPAGEAVTSLQACISANNSTPTVAYRDVLKTGSSFTFNLTQAERNALLSTTPNSNSKTLYFILKTVIGGNTYYSSKAVTFSVVNANPTISAVNYADTNSTTTAITSNNQIIIQANSTVRVTLPTLTAFKYSSLASVSLNVNGQSFSKTLTGTTASNTYFDVGTINSSENITATVTLTDSRGNTATATKTITMLAWKLPTAINSLTRKSNYYDESYIKVDGSVSSLNNLNTMTIEYRYKERGSNTWGAWVTINDNQTYILSLDNQKSFDFQTRITDRIGSTTYNLVLQIGIPILYIDRLLRSVGVGTIPNEVNMLAIDRRLSLKNQAQETIADLYANPSSDPARSGLMYFYDNAGLKRLMFSGYDRGTFTIYKKGDDTKHTVIISGTSYGGALSLYDNSENRAIYLYAGSNGEGNLNINKGGILSVYNSSNVRTILAYTATYGGRLLIANNSAGSSIDLTTGSAGDGTINVYNSSGSYTINLSGESGVVRCVSVVQTSSRKVKENIKPITSEEANKILLLEAVTFDYKDKKQGVDRRGFIAEEVKEVIPQIVTDETEDTPASLDYIELIPYLQTVIKEQAKLIKDLEKRIEALEQQNSV